MLSSLNALTSNTINLNYIKKFNLNLDLKKELTYECIIDFLNKSGYTRVDFVHDIAQFSIRGEILDIFSPIYNNPIRILFNFDKIESLNFFRQKVNFLLKLQTNID